MSEMITKIWRRTTLFSKKRQALPLATIASNDPSALPLAPDHSRYINREISDLKFVQRVMEEVLNDNHPLLERLRFLSISASVLDQFYAVRVAKLKRAAQKRDAYITPDGMTPIAQLRAVLRLGDSLMQSQVDSWETIAEELSGSSIHLKHSHELDTDELEWLHYYFRSHILPLLTPSTIDEEHPFPFIASGEVCTILEFADRHILIPLPRGVSRFVPLPGEEGRFILLENVIFRFWTDLFPHDTLASHGVFQPLRDNDLARQERSDDLRSMIESGLRMRHKANTVLLKVSDTMSERAISFIALQLDLLSEEQLLFFKHQQRPVSDSKNVFVTSLPGLDSISDLITPLVVNRHRDLMFAPYVPRDEIAATGENIFDLIARKDLLVHWPFESFDSVVAFLNQAAEDTGVSAIKQTLYRTSDDSPIVAALINAAQHGKSVTTVIELEARENESSNVQLAKRLEAAGVHIIYGIVGLKIHCKATLVVRREDDATVLYSHFSSGNYHPGSARMYTDLSFFTRDPDLGQDANTVFNYLTSGTMLETKKLVVAPLGLRRRLYELIDNEIALARSGNPGHIYIKVNSFTDPHMVERLYAASEAGVEIDLVVRRHCALRPGIPGMSSRIRVKSIVGRFLEHSRIYLFSNGGPIDGPDAHVLMGSPDLMERNLDERVEILVPISDPDLRERIVNEVMHGNILDKRQSWILREDNTYERVADDGFCAQSFFMKGPAKNELGSLKASIDD